MSEKMTKKKVTWYESSDGEWKCTGCDISWFFTDGGPEENGVKFCFGCGKQIGKVEPYQDDCDDEDDQEEYRENENDMPGGF